MFKTHRKKLLVTLAMVGCVAVSVAAYTPDAKEQPRKRNLKVLPENISKDSLHDVMEGFNDALGVKCNFCHAPRKDDATKLDFGSDDKPEKDIARSMMRMTADINGKYFNFNSSTRPDTIRAVSCMTCHKGNAHINDVAK